MKNDFDIDKESVEIPIDTSSIPGLDRPKERYLAKQLMGLPIEKEDWIALKKACMEDFATFMEICMGKKLTPEEAERANKEHEQFVQCPPWRRRQGPTTEEVAKMLTLHSIRNPKSPIIIGDKTFYIDEKEEEKYLAWREKHGL